MKRVIYILALVLCLNSILLPAEAAEVPEAVASEASIPVSCDTVREMADIWEYMMVNGLTEYSVMEQVKDWNWHDMISESYHIASDELVEYWSFYNTCALRRQTFGDTVKITFYLMNRSGLSGEVLSNQAKLFEEETQKMFQDLCESGVLTEQMTQKEKALALNNYVCGLLQYDLSYANATAYEALRDGKAVCHGYTAIYNRFCHLAGIPATAQRGYTRSQYHVWSKIPVDGAEDMHVDVTWNDDAQKNTWFWLPISSFSWHYAIN